MIGQFKLPLLFIGKAVNPRWMREETRQNYLYYSQISSWMDQDIWADWFENQYVVMVEGYLKANNLPLQSILFCDNCSPHMETLSSKNGNHIVLYLPPNTTGFIQPMDQEVIAVLKLLFEKKYHEEYFLWRDKQPAESNTYEIFASGTNTNFAIETYIKCWNEISVRNLQRAWEPILTPFAESLEMELSDIQNTPPPKRREEEKKEEEEV